MFNPIYFNYGLLVQFAIMAFAWAIAGDGKQAAYFLGAFMCTAAVTFK